MDGLLIRPTSDIFTAVLWSAPKNEPILIDFINAVLLNSKQPPVREAKAQNRFNIKEFAFDRQFILDVRVKDELERQYNIEVQTAWHTGFYDRMLVQWADIYSSQLRTGVHFAQLKPVKSIVLTDFPIFPELRNLHTIFEIRSQENPDMLLTDHFQMHFIRLGDMRRRRLDVLDILGDDLQHWLNFFTFGATVSEDNMTQLLGSSPAVLAAYEEFKRFTMDEEMQDMERRRRRFLEDHRIYVDAARGEGIAQGKIEGKIEREFEIIRNMRRKDYGVEAIAELTGLSSAEIESID
jgi:predicted transposase/invertase (TIGR01784 family)